MKNLLFGLALLASAAAASGCRETSKLPEPAIESMPLIFPEYSSDVNKTYYNFTYSNASLIDLVDTLGNPVKRSVFEFTINPTNRDIKIRTVEVYKSFASLLTNGNGNTPLGSPVPYGQSYKFGPRVKVGDYNSFPAKISLDSKAALTGLYYLDTDGGSSPIIPAYPALPNGDYDDNTSGILKPGNAVMFTFEYVLADGRRIVLTPLDNRGAITGTFTAVPYSALALFRAPTK